MSLESGSGGPSPGSGPSGEGVSGGPSSGGLEGGDKSSDKGGDKGGSGGLDGSDGGGSGIGGPAAGGAEVGSAGGGGDTGGPSGLGGGEIGEPSSNSGGEIGGPGPAGPESIGTLDATPFVGSELNKAEQTEQREEIDQSSSDESESEQTTGRATGFSGGELSRASFDTGRGQSGTKTGGETRSSATGFKTETGKPTEGTGPATEEVNPGRPPEMNPNKQSDLAVGKPSSFGTAKPAEMPNARPEEVSPAKPAEIVPASTGKDQGLGGQKGQKAGEVNPARPSEVNPARPNEVQTQRQTEMKILKPDERPDPQPAEFTPQRSKGTETFREGQPVMSAKPESGKSDSKTGEKAEGGKSAEKATGKAGDSGDKTGSQSETAEEKAARQKEAVEKHIEESKREMDEAIAETYKDDPEKQAKMQELAERMQQATKPYYDKSVEVAAQAKGIENFSDHNKAHISEVTTGAVKNAEQMHKMEDEKGLPPEARVKDDVMIAAAQWHDVGMAGTKEDREAIENDPNAKLDGNRIRTQHSYESGMAILENQDKFDDPDQAFETALVTYLHSKSNSGVPSLGDKQAVTNAANRLKNDYESKHEGQPGLDLSRFGRVNEKGELVDLDPDVQTRITNEALTLRIADAQRTASDSPTTMTGRVMESEKVQYDDTSGFESPLADEVVDNKVEYTDPNDPDAPKDESTNETALKYTNGERNVDAGTINYTDDGTMEVTYVVKDAYVDQAATREVLDERMKEAESAPAAKDAAPGSVNREQVVHVVQIEKGDEAARAALERVLNSEEFGATYYTKNGEKVTRTVRVELKQ